MQEEVLLASMEESQIWLRPREGVVVKRFKQNTADAISEIRKHEEMSYSVHNGVVAHRGNNVNTAGRGRLELEMEYCAQGSLLSFIKNQCGKRLEERRLLTHFVNMMVTVAEMHKLRIVHRAITVDNWLVTADEEIKLSDFGYHKFIETNGSLRTVSLHDGTGASTKRIFAMDVFFLGKVFLQMVRMNTAGTLNLTEQALDDECAGYSSTVRTIIKSLCLPGGGARQQDVLRVLQNLSEQARLPSLEVMLSYSLEESACDICFRCLEVWRQPCGHFYCEECLSFHETPIDFSCRLCISLYRETADTTVITPSCLQATNFKFSF